MKNLIVASTSTLFGGSFLDYLLPVLKTHFGLAKSLLFIPYARPGGISHAAYTQKVREAVSSLPIEVKGIHEAADPKIAIEAAEAIFVGGGNTFVLMDQLYKNGLLKPLRRVLENGIPYLGTSAGSNIVGQSVKTTNDMPIVHPPSLDALGLTPFNINPHYLDPDPTSQHNGETRETRIAEFHHYNDIDVVGLREGSWIEVKGDVMLLKGELSARIFKQNTEPFELEAGADLKKAGLY